MIRNNKCIFNLTKYNIFEICIMISTLKMYIRVVFLITWKKNILTHLPMTEISHWYLNGFKNFVKENQADGARADRFLNSYGFITICKVIVFKRYI